MNYITIAFFGHVESCDPRRIGGCESFIRRLSSSLVSSNISVSIVMYGARQEQELKWNNLKLFYFNSFSGALKKLDSQDFNYIGEVYIHKRYYLRYLLFKKQKQNKTKFFSIFLTWPEGKIRRYLTIKVKTLFCKSVFAVSPRLVREINEKGISAVWLPPLIPDRYFSLGRKLREKIVMSYIGRISPDKGINNLLRTFEDVQKFFGERVSLKIYGYYDPLNRESTILYEKLKILKGVEQQIQSHKNYQYSPQGEELLLNRLRETDILVLPYENLRGTIDIPFLVLEGLAAGCLVISTDIGDVSEIIGKRGLTFRNNSELKKNLWELLSSKMFKRYQLNFRVKELFSQFSAFNVVKKFIFYLIEK